jgi:hypothetical protein
MQQHDGTRTRSEHPMTGPQRHRIHDGVPLLFAFYNVVTGVALMAASPRVPAFTKVILPLWLWGAAFAVLGGLIFATTRIAAVRTTVVAFGALVLYLVWDYLVWRAHGPLVPLRAYVVPAATGVLHLALIFTCRLERE